MPARLALALAGGGDGKRRWPAEIVMSAEGEETGDTCETLHTARDLEKAIARMDNAQSQPKTKEHLPAKVFGKAVKNAKKIGKGSFGNVFRCDWGKRRGIIVKVSSGSSRISTLQEGAQESAVQITLACMLAEKPRNPAKFAGIPDVFFVKGYREGMRYYTAIGMEPLLKTVWDLTRTPFRSAEDYALRVDALWEGIMAVARTLGVLQERCRFMHNDLKPNNIMISTRGHVKLIDFGASSLDVPVVKLQKRASWNKTRIVQDTVRGAEREFNAGTDLVMFLSALCMGEWTERFPIPSFLLFLLDPAVAKFVEIVENTKMPSSALRTSQLTTQEYIKRKWGEGLVVGDPEKQRSVQGWRAMYMPDIADVLGDRVVRAYSPESVLAALGADEMKKPAKEKETCTTGESGRCRLTRRGEKADKTCAKHMETQRCRRVLSKRAKTP